MFRDGKRDGDVKGCVFIISLCSSVFFSAGGVAAEWFSASRLNIKSKPSWLYPSSRSVTPRRASGTKRLNDEKQKEKLYERYKIRKDSEKKGKSYNSFNLQQ